MVGTETKEWKGKERNEMKTTVGILINVADENERKEKIMILRLYYLNFFCYLSEIRIYVKLNYCYNLS